MELLKFTNEEEYINAQRHTRNRRDRNRAKRAEKGVRRRGTFFLPQHIYMMADHVARYGPKGDPHHILCHGVRCGAEMEEVRKAFPPLTKVWGTDLFPDGEEVIEWDFRKPRQKWVGRFHIVYSNSLDHSDDPLDTLQVWLDQLTREGKLFVEWTLWHSLKVKDGDCFAASFEEYLAMFEELGTVHDILYARPSRLLIVAGK